MHSPVRPVSIAMHDVQVVHRPDGAVLFHPCEALGPYPARATAMLEHWAAKAPGRTLLAERGSNGKWRRLTYADALDGARRVGQALPDRRLSAERPDTGGEFRVGHLFVGVSGRRACFCDRYWSFGGHQDDQRQRPNEFATSVRPVAILSGNGIEHLVLMLAALHVGVPALSVSVAYSRIGEDFARLRACLGLVTPGLVFAGDGDAYAAALAAAQSAEVVTVAGGPPGAPRRAGLPATAPGPALDEAAGRVGPDTLAKILFTSGSTRLPKCVVTTHRMLCNNQVMILQSFPFLGEEPPVLPRAAQRRHAACG